VIRTSLRRSKHRKAQSQTRHSEALVFKNILQADSELQHGKGGMMQMTLCANTGKAIPTVASTLWALVGLHPFKGCMLDMHFSS